MVYQFTFILPEFAQLLQCYNKLSISVITLASKLLHNSYRRVYYISYIYVSYKANIVTKHAAIDSENNNGLQHSTNTHTIRIYMYMHDLLIMVYNNFLVLSYPKQSLTYASTFTGKRHK